MTGRLGLALVAGLATVLTASSLLPLVEAGDWIAAAIGAVLLVVLTGEGSRRVRVPRPLVGLVQLAALILYLLVVCVPDVSGPVPTPSAIRAFADLLDAGAADIRQYSPPAPETEGLTAILLCVVGAVAVLVDVIAVTYGQAAPAGLPLLALYSVPAALAESGLGWGVFGLAGLAYVLLLLADGRDRLLRWGRPLAPPSGTGGRPPRTAARGGVRIGFATLAVAVAVPAFIPLSASRLLEDDADDGRSRRITTINPVVSLQNELNRSENTELMRYTTNAIDPGSMYLRISSLDRFDGRSWQPSERRLSDVPKELPPPAGLGPEVTRNEVVTRVKALDNYKQDSLPLPYPASSVQVRGDWRFESEGRLLLGDKKQTTRGLSWTVTSLDVRPTAQQLRDAGPPPPELAAYQSLPLASGVQRRIQDLARQVGGTGTMYDQARRIEEWFARSGEFRYDTTVPGGNGASALENFLKQKVGYCEQFSSAMAVMARSLGIPARVAVGFVPGEPQSDGGFKVSSHDAHAWPELYFSGAGWIRFEPTPSRGSQPAWSLPDAAPALPSLPPDAEVPEEPTKAPEADPGCTPGSAGAGCATPSPTAAPVAAGGGGDSGISGRWLLGGGAAVLGVLLLLLPMSLRLRVRRRRMSALTRDASAGADTGTSGGPVLGGWSEVLDTARDLGFGVSGAQTPRQTAARLASLLEPADGEAATPSAEAARAALHRVALAAERLLFAASPPVLEPGFAADVRAVRQGLLEKATRGARLRASLLPASLRPAGRGAGKARRTPSWWRRSPSAGEEGTAPGPVG